MDSNDIKLRNLIPSTVAPNIIDIHGYNIFRFCEKYNAKVRVPYCLGPERIVTIISSNENALKVLNQVLGSLVVGGSRFERDKTGGQVNNDNQGEADVRVLIHPEQVECIFENCGLNVNELIPKNWNTN